MDKKYDDFDAMGLTVQLPRPDGTATGKGQDLTGNLARDKQEGSEAMNVTSP